MWVRPSTAFYSGFSLDMDRSPGFGPAASDSYALLTLAFTSAPPLQWLNLAGQRSSPDRSTKSTRLCSTDASICWALPQLVNTGFQVLFHSPPGVLFTFPSRYCSSIGHQVVFRLGWWSTRFPTGFHVSRGTLDPAQSASPFAYGVLTLYDRPSQTVRLN